MSDPEIKEFSVSFEATHQIQKYTPIKGGLTVHFKEGEDIDTALRFVSNKVNVWMGEELAKRLVSG